MTEEFRLVFGDAGCPVTMEEFDKLKLRLKTNAALKDLVDTLDHLTYSGRGPVLIKIPESDQPALRDELKRWIDEEKSDTPPGIKALWNVLNSRIDAGNGDSYHD